MFNSEKTIEEYKKTPLFLGAEPGLFDTVNKQYPRIWSLYKEMKSLDWSEDEFDYSQCNIDFKNCPKDVSDMMIRTLAWQWEADSVASRSIIACLAPFITSSELFAAWGRISDNECLIDGTEVLTEKGWVDLADLCEGQSIAQYDPDTKTISFVIPSRIIENDFDGELISFKNSQNHFNQVVTPNHRMILTNYGSGGYKVGLASEFKFGSASMKTGGIVSGFLRGKRNYLTPFERFLIAVQADGSISDRYDGSLCGHVPVRFGFSKERKIKRLLEICKDCGLNCIELSESIRTGNTKNQKTFKVEVPVQYIKYLKNFDWVNISDVDHDWCRDFLNEIVQWDGHFTKNTGILHTTSLQAATITQTIASLCGMKTHFRKIEDNRKETFSDCYRVSWKNQDYVSGQAIKKERIKYNGKVRCVTVDSGFFLIRYKDSISVTGNCIHAATYSEIVRMSFDKPEEVLSEILSVKESLERLETVSSVFKQAQEKGCLYILKQIPNDQELYNSVYNVVQTLLMLERIQFMSSFGVTFTVCSTGIFQPIGKAVQKICQDELEVHCELDKEVLRTEWKTERGMIAKEQTKSLASKVFHEIVDSELKWVEYLFSEGRSLVGANEEMLKQWVLFNAKDVARFLDIESDFSFPKKNPMPNLENWINMNKQQAAPQEQDLAAYKIGATKKDDEGVNFDVDF